MEKDNNLNEEENLQTENDFLKMKIMLEYGGDFSGPNENDTMLTPEIENEFLNNIIEFEKQFQSRKTITVFDKIGKPEHFKSVQDIPDDSMEEEWNKLSGYMQGYSVNLSACSPKVSARELYRFTTEKLFKYETDDINIPGMMTGFVYDEFYPDYEYNNTESAIDDCIKLILRKEPIEFMPWLAKENIRLNMYTDLTREKLKEIINNFKNKFDDIEAREINNVVCELQKENCIIRGTHETTLVFDNTPVISKGNWLVEFIWDDGFWVIVNVQIEGLQF